MNKLVKKNFMFLCGLLMLAIGILSFPNVGTNIYADEINMISPVSPQETYTYGTETNIELTFTPPENAQINEWQIKLPNNATFDKITEQQTTNNYTFKPEDFGGSGTYYFIVKYTQNNQSYFSEIERIIVNPQSFNDISEIKISYKEISNTKSSATAFLLTISNADYLDGSKIKWYLKSTYLGNGLTYTFEPETKGEYEISAVVESSVTLRDKVNLTATAGNKLLKYIIAGSAIGLLAIALIITITINIKNEKIFR